MIETVLALVLVGVLKLMPLVLAPPLDPSDEGVAALLLVTLLVDEERSPIDSDDAEEVAREMLEDVDELLLDAPVKMVMSKGVQNTTRPLSHLCLILLSRPPARPSSLWLASPLCPS